MRADQKRTRVRGPAKLMRDIAILALAEVFTTAELAQLFGLTQKYVVSITVSNADARLSSWQRSYNAGRALVLYHAWTAIRQRLSGTAGRRVSPLKPQEITALLADLEQPKARHRRR